MCGRRGRNANDANGVTSHHSERVFKRLDDSPRLHLSHREGVWLLAGVQLLRTEAEF